MWSRDPAGISEAYADELMDGVDTSIHGGGDSAGLRGAIPVHMNAWLIIVLSLVLLWLIGGVVFKGVNI